MHTRPTLWLRTEDRPADRRSILSPTVASELIAQGFPVVVESCRHRIFSDAEFSEAGCRISARGEWQNAPEDTVVLGLKGIPVDAGPLRHRHVYFAHAYKYQDGWMQILHQFTEGRGTLLDLEYLVDDAGVRLVAFGFWAGYTGAAAALLAWSHNQNSPDTTLPGLHPESTRQAMESTVRSALASSRKSPSVLIIGASGRCGRGAVELCRSLDLDITCWGRQNTLRGGPFKSVLEHDILINCVFVDSPIAPFTTREHLSHPGRRLSVISDVSCDVFSAINPLPVYDRVTTADDPCLRLFHSIRMPPAAVPVLDLLAVDCLPSLLPRESSEQFAEILGPILSSIDQPDCAIWQRARETFENKQREAITHRRHEMMQCV